MSRGRPDGDGDDAEAVRGFMSRWSRRKRAPEAEPDPEDVAAAEAAAQAEDEAKAKAEAEDTRTDEEILRDLGLPDPDNLGAGDDFKQFMAPHVPARFRTRALRKLWPSNPVLANLTGMNDYDLDYTGRGPDSVVQVGNIKTAYRVGRGLLKAVDKIVAEDAGAATSREAGAEARAPDAPQAEAAAGDPAAGDDQGTTTDTQAETAANPAATDRKPSPTLDHRAAQVPDPAPDPALDPAPRPLRRMQFRPVTDPARKG